MRDGRIIDGPRRDEVISGTSLEVEAQTP